MRRVTGGCIGALALTMGLAGVAHGQPADRYGPSTPDYAAAPSASPIILAGAPMRVLSWPGKVAAPVTGAQAAAPVLRPEARAELPPVLRPRRPAQVAASRPVRRRAAEPRDIQTAGPQTVASPAVAPQAVAPVFAALPAPSATSPHYGLVQAVPAPPSIYDPAAAPRSGGAARQATPAQVAPIQPAAAQPRLANPAAGQLASVQKAPVQKAPVQAAARPPSDHPGWAPPRHAWSQANDDKVRFYSLHRQYGVTPDPAPIPPQFFTATADLGDPPGPMTRTISGAGSTAQAARAVQAAQAETSSDPSSSQP